VGYNTNFTLNPTLAVGNWHASRPELMSTLCVVPLCRRLITVSEAFLVISVNPLLTAMLAPIFLTDTSWRMYVFTPQFRGSPYTIILACTNLGISMSGIFIRALVICRSDKPYEYFGVLYVEDMQHLPLM
jgi:hypothetical protein